MKKQYTENIINAFLNNSTCAAIARETGLSETTVRRYRDDPCLQQILGERRQAMITDAVETMRSFMKEGTETLIKIIRDSSTPAQTRVNALNLLFTQFRDWVTTTEIQQRIEVLEVGNGANWREMADFDGGSLAP